MKRLEKISKNEHCAKLVRKINFGFNEASSHRRDASFTQQFVEHLPSILTQLPDIRALQFNEPSAKMRQWHRDRYMETVASCLRRVPLPSLKELIIKFPITRDFEKFYLEHLVSRQDPIESVLHRLQRLELHVCSRYVVAPSEQSFASKNRLYAPHLCQMVEGAPSLNDLALKSADTIDIDNLNWPSTPRLRYLNLEGVAISSDTLISLMHQSAETMEGVYFWRVELKSGTWLKIILEMGKLPRLTDVILSRCAYSATGTSAHLDTTNAFDEAALEWLLRKINRRRIKFGYEPFNEWTMEGANEIPLKTIADHAQDIQELAEAIRSLAM